MGSLILSNNKFKLKNVIFKNLSYPKNKEKILHGGVNIINSNVEIYDTKIISSNSEDAINIISSESNINNLELSNIFADGIDIDFGSSKFRNIRCENILNDYFDVSFASVKGENLEGNNINDKALSFGENSNGKISNINFQNSKLGIAVKDGSKLEVSNYLLKNNEYDVAVFNKKKEYESAILRLNNAIEDKKLNYVLGNNNYLYSDKLILENKIDNYLINQLFY